MRKLVIGMAMASTALASPALARDGQWYVEVQGGPMIVQDTEFDVNDGAGTVTTDTQEGYDFGGVVGYDFGAFRLEAEASFREGDIDNLSADSAGLPRIDGNSIGVTPAGVYPAAGDVNSLSFMVNGLFDFGPDDGLQAFAGGGIGVARTDVHASANPRTPGVFDDSSSGLAWQLLAGVRAPLSDSWDVGLRYRMFTAENVELVDTLGRDNEGTLRTHSILGTLTYNFGGPAEIATQTCWDGSVIPVTEACPARPTPPPPPTQTCWNGSVIPATATCPARPEPAVCKQGPYIVFFEWDKSDITPEAATILNNAVSAYSNCGTAAVMLAGHTDTSGTKVYNEGLSQRRNASVRAYLTSRGIPDARISSEAFGETQLRVPTADGVRELQNRRVEITYGPGSGM
ncbi:OmpA family protein [Erythrobacter sp. HKB08]|uniref:OmpA family protein n=1 Tax=Erythrobacter sp. HKB08 TaxID=2502843 RepID=UPI0010087460|nr:OmpA family protein [Erythrobacter sp. HKB08]